MKTKLTRFPEAALILAGALIVPFAASAQSIPGIPEPGFGIYGTVTTTNGIPRSGLGVVWRVVTGGTATTNAATAVVVNGQGFYAVRIPFETRSIPGTPAFTATPNTLALTSTDTSYTRSATVNGTVATLQASTNFTFSIADRGRIERVNLVVALPPETFAEWAQRIFGTSAIDPNADPDHDGASNMKEYLAGTDPLSDQSVFKFISIQPGLPSGIVIQWSSVPGKLYSVERSLLVATNYAAIATNLSATNSLMSFYDPTATGAGPYFYRLKTQ